MTATTADDGDHGDITLNPDGRTGRVCLDFDDRDIHATLSEVDPAQRADFARRAFKIGLIALREAIPKEC